jgi:hypothetical protein
VKIVNIFSRKEKQRNPMNTAWVPAHELKFVRKCQKAASGKVHKYPRKNKASD